MSRPLRTPFAADSLGRDPGGAADTLVRMSQREIRAHGACLVSDIPPPSDPDYPWSITDTSVAITSINFWILATTLTERVLHGHIDPTLVKLDDGAVPDTHWRRAWLPARPAAAAGAGA